MVAVPLGVEQEIISPEQLNADMDKLANAIKGTGRKFKRIYAPPRGGWPIATWLSHRMNDIPVVNGSLLKTMMELRARWEQKCSPGLSDEEKWLAVQKKCQEWRDETLVVDDISDTGKALCIYKKFFRATWYLHKQSKNPPDIWIREKTEKWIRFPWEIA
ncbi:MAG: hypothetical protein G01um101419_495 [Parcubacteria group bacterium Gr01-1014_19]|nr:MAG: hypothetical protein G01um101419_495 [Parcubacteria group bacterium Gr01-1014_19]